MSFSRFATCAFLVTCVAVVLYPPIADYFPAKSGVGRLASGPFTLAFFGVALATAILLFVRRPQRPEVLRIAGLVLVTLGIVVLLTISFLPGFVFLFSGRDLWQEAKKRAPVPQGPMPN